MSWKGVKMNPKGFIQWAEISQLAKYRKYPNLLLAGNVGTQENQRVYGMVLHKLLAETEEENLYICDGKNDGIIRVMAGLFVKLSNVE